MIDIVALRIIKKSLIHYKGTHIGTSAPAADFTGHGDPAFRNDLRRLLRRGLVEIDGRKGRPWNLYGISKLGLVLLEEDGDRPT
jgi:hypothetical protein